MMEIIPGKFYQLPIARKVTAGVYLDDGDKGILLPKRFVPHNAKPGDSLNVFIYHDSENRLIATTQQPKAQLGEIALLKAVSTTHQGAFLDWGLMKDLFIPKSQQLSVMRTGAHYLVKLYLDEQTGRVAATEKFEKKLSEAAEGELQEKQEVELLAFRETPLGWVMIINNTFSGMLHKNEIFQTIKTGDKFTGFIKAIKPDYKIDVLIGKAGYGRVDNDSNKVLSLLVDNNGYLPFNDKSDPQNIYDVFGMSKKTFKMVLGKLYKERKIDFGKEGIILIDK